MKKNVIFGCENFAQMLRLYLEEAGLNITAFCVDDAYANKSEYHGLPLLNLSNFLKLYDSKNCNVYVAIGYMKMNQVRAEKVQFFQSLGYSTPNFVHSNAYIDKNAILKGTANFVFENVTISMLSQIGTGNIFFPGANVAHNAVVGSWNTISLNAVLCGFSEVSDYCFLGASSCVRDKIIINSYTIAGANTFIGNDTAQYDVYAAPKPIKLDKTSLEVEI